MRAAFRRDIIAREEFELGICSPATHAPALALPDTPLSPTIFHEPWWLEIASAGAASEVTVSTGGALIGRLPYLVSRRIPGLTVLGVPALAHVLGPAIVEPTAPGGFPNPVKQVSITRDLIAQLPRAAHISFRLHGGVTNTLAFDAAGFSNSVAYTAEIPPAPVEVLWRQMRDKTRNVIRRAQESLAVDRLADPHAFMDFYEANLLAKGMRSYYDREISTRIIAACLHRRAGCVLTARDSSGQLQSAVLTVWDRKTEYYFMSTRAPDSHNGATSLLIWTAIQHAALNGLTFDMDGLHVLNNRLANLGLFAGFGGIIKPRYIVRRTWLPVQAAKRVCDLLSKS